MSKHTNKQYVQMFRNGDMSKVQDFSEQFGITVEAAEEIAQYTEENGTREGLTLRKRDDAPFVRISIMFNTRVHGMRAKDGRMFVTKNGKIVIRH